jgi:uncharacterized protein (DUF2147 family)
MKRLLATAAFLLASTAAQAQYTIEYGGHTIRIDPDRGTVSIPGVYDNTGRGKAKKAKNDTKNDTKSDTRTDQAKTSPQAEPAPAQAPATAPPVAAQPPAPPAPTATANNAPAETAIVPPQAPAAPAPAVTPPPAPTVATAPAAPPAPPPVQAAAAPAAATLARDPNSPLGVWLTEEKEGQVRIEQCGSNLCGYSVDAKSNQNGEQILINMKPGKEQKWSGRILDPNTGSTYDSTIAMKGTDRLRVQGCALGGMFCGGQTWTRVN